MCGIRAPAGGGGWRWDYVWNKRHFRWMWVEGPVRIGRERGGKATERRRYGRSGGQRLE